MKTISSQTEHALLQRLFPGVFRLLQPIITHPHHAYGVSGPYEGGQRSIMNLIAQRMVCSEPTENSTIPCSLCVECRLFLNNAHPDVITITKQEKQTIGIDAAKQIRTHLQHSGGKRRIALIHEAELLTTSAVNALLKIIEEPPAHAVILFHTAALEQLLPTLRSRIQLISTPTLSTQQVRSGVEEVASDMLSLDELMEYSNGRVQRVLDMLTGRTPLQQWAELSQLVTTFFNASLQEREELLQKRFLKASAKGKEKETDLFPIFLELCCLQLHHRWSKDPTNAPRAAQLKRLLTLQQMQEQHVNKKMICDYLTLTI